MRPFRPTRSALPATIAATLAVGALAGCAGFGGGELGADEARLPRITLDPLAPRKGRMFRIEYDFDQLPLDDVILRVSFRPSGGISDHGVTRQRPWVEVFAPPMADFVSIEDRSGPSARRAAAVLSR